MITPKIRVPFKPSTYRLNSERGTNFGGFEGLLAFDEFLCLYNWWGWNYIIWGSMGVQTSTITRYLEDFGTIATQPIASQRNIQRGWSRVWSEILLEFELRKPCTHLIYWQLLYLFSFLWMTGEIDVSLLWWVNCQILEAFIHWMTIGFQVYSPNTHIFCPWKQAKLLPKTKGLPCNHQMSGLWPLVLGRLCPFFRETKRVAKDSHKNCQTVSNFPWKKSPTYQCKPR